MRTIPKFDDYIKSITPTTKEPQDSKPDDISSEDKIIQGFSEYKNNVKSDLLERIKCKSPKFFENLVRDLAEKMGYGIIHKVVGKSGDGGIDVIAKMDEFGLEEIYFQAKKWEGNVASRDVRDFVGAISAKKSRKGIFITSSDFSKDAYDYVNQTDARVTLINGEGLLELMYKHGLGLSKKDTYEIKEIDEDYFSRFDSEDVIQKN